MFTAPLEMLTAADVNALMGWPESMTAEFKRQIPSRDNRQDAWVAGGKVEVYGRDGLFKEIVALANTAGGHLVIGVDEDKGNPPLAVGITPVPRCAELAGRLLQMAQIIDPPISYLGAWGIPTDGDAGVVVVRVPASRTAPHRSTDKEVYVRRGSNSLPVSMREVRDMVLSTERGSAAVEEMFSLAAKNFGWWMARHLPPQTPGAPPLPQAGFRITAIPIGTTFDLRRLPGRLDQNHLARQQFRLDGGSIATCPRLPMSTRPMVRGVEMHHPNQVSPSYFVVQTSGMISAALKMAPHPSGKAVLMLSWVLGYMLNVLRLADFCRDDAGVPECEYAVETQLALEQGDCLALLNCGMGFDDDIGELSSGQLPLTLPRLPYGARGEKNRVITDFANDFTDAVGGYRQAPWDLRIVQ